MVLTLNACSTQKNTGATRFYHQMKTKYNIQLRSLTDIGCLKRKLLKSSGKLSWETLPVILTAKIIL